jgi:hypothetical protein
MQEFIQSLIDVVSVDSSTSVSVVEATDLPRDAEALKDISETVCADGVGSAAGRLKENGLNQNRTGG